MKEGKTPSRLWRETHYEPKAGRLIMFPSWVMHCVDPNQSDDIRISVSFNFLQKGQRLWYDISTTKIPSN